MSDIVYFEMPDGTKVSNDPKFDLAAVEEELLASQPNRGDVGTTAAEWTAQHQVEHMVNLNSGQPGVGENAVPEDPKDYIPNTGTPAMQTQKDDLKQAQEAGADLTSTSVQDPEPVDSNAAVKEAQEAEAARQEKLKAAQDALGEGEPGDPDVPFADWTSKQLKLEVARRNAERGDDDQLDISGMTKKSQVVELLEADDAAQQSSGENTQG